MDDQSFDDLIKGKLDHYKDPDFDPFAHAGLQNRLASFQSQPWYVQHRGKIVAVAAAVLFTMINGYMLSLMISTSKQTENKMSSMGSKKIDSLTSTIHRLINVQEITLTKVDSLAIFYQNMTNRYEHEISLLTAEKFDWHETALIEKERGQSLDKLISDNLIRLEDNQLTMARPYRKRELISTSALSYVGQKSIHLNTKFFHLVKASPTDMPTEVDHSVSAKTRNALEKHYFPGLGINVAPHADLLQPFARDRKGGVSPRLGISADWIVSPKLSIETSIDYSSINYSLNHNFENFNIPTYNQNLGDLTRLRVTTKLASAPISLKYRHWLTYRDQVFIKAGYTPYYSFANRYEMEYRVSGQSGHDNDDLGTINQLQKNELNKFYGSTFSVGMGLTRMIRKSDKIELGLVYERSLRPVGQEKINIQLLGVRAAYWFSIK